MTCVVGLLDKGDVWMGADSLAVSGDFATEVGAPKIFRKGPFVIGYAGSPRAQQLVEYTMKVPDHPVKMSNREFMSTCFVDAIRTCLKEGGYARKEDEVEEFDSTYIVGYRGQVFTIYSDYQVATTLGEFAAIGSGRELASASLFSTEKMHMPPRSRVITALKTAAKFCTTVNGPFHVVRLRGA